MDYSSLSDADILKLCVWRESRGASPIDWQGVTHVILNRVRKNGWFGTGIKGVILKPEQFSSFNPSDANSEKVPDPSNPQDWDAYQKISTLCDSALAGESFDITQNALYYVDHSIVAPQWSEGLQISLQTQFFTFYRTPEPTTSVTDVELGT